MPVVCPSVRAGFVDFVTRAINTAEQSTIVRVGSLVTVDDGPTGLRVTTKDGWDLSLRALSLDLPGMPAGRPGPTFGEEVVDREDD